MKKNGSLVLSLSLLALLGASSTANAMRSNMMLLLTNSNTLNPDGFSDYIPESVKSFFEVEKNVALHGAVDSDGRKRLFLVLGLKPGTEHSMEWLKSSIRRGDVMDLRNNVYDPEHRHDVTRAARDGVQSAENLAPKIFLKPFESLKEGKRAFWAELSSANDAYYHEGNTTVAAAKYSALAGFAVAKGGYFMIVEAPAEFVGYTIGTVGTIPAHVGWQFLTIGYGGTKIGVKFAAHVFAAAMTEAYSIISSSTAVVITSISAGVMKLSAGAHWLASLPHNYQYPVRLYYRTHLGVDEAEKVSNQLVDFLKSKGYEPKTSYSASKFTSATTVLDGKILINIYPSAGNLFASVEASKAFLASDEMKDRSQAEVQQILEAKVTALVAEFSHVLPPDAGLEVNN